MEEALIQKMKVLNEAGKDIYMASRLVSKISDKATRDVYEAQLLTMVGEFNKETAALIRELEELVVKEKQSNVRSLQLNRMHRILKSGHPTRR